MARPLSRLASAPKGVNKHEHDNSAATQPKEPNHFGFRPIFPLDQSQPTRRGRLVTYYQELASTAGGRERETEGKRDCGSHLLKAAGERRQNM